MEFCEGGGAQYSTSCNYYWRELCAESVDSEAFCNLSTATKWRKQTNIDVLVVNNKRPLFAAKFHKVTVS